jgi:hypothetical protein
MSKSMSITMETITYIVSQILSFPTPLPYCSCALATHIQNVMMSNNECGFGGVGWCICSKIGLCCAIASWFDQVKGIE